VYIIDAFDSTQDALLTAGGSNPKLKTDSTANNAPDVLGGQREFAVRRENGVGSVELDVNYNFPGGVSFSQNGNARGRGLITYDGAGTGTVNLTNYDPPNGQYGVPDTFGLTGTGTTGGVDLTQGDTLDRIKIQAHSDLANSPLTLTFYVSATQYATSSVMLAAGTYDGLGNPILDTYTFLMSGFTVTGAASPLDIFKDTKAITIRINGASGADILMDYFVAAEPNPEPSTISLMAGAVLVAGLRFWKKRRTA
jgi:hypothetical protein